jgi:two-component system sensor histidine kinase YesM
MLLKWLTARPLKSMILLLFIPIIIVFVLAIGIISYSIAAKDLKNYAYSSTRDTINQAKSNINDRLTALFSDVVAFDTDSELSALITRLKQPGYQMQPEEYIYANAKINTLYQKYYAETDAVILSLADGRFTQAKTDLSSDEPKLIYTDYANRYNGNPSGVYWRNLHNNDVFPEATGAGKVASLVKMIGYRGSTQSLVLVQLKESYFQKILDNFQVSGHGYLILASEDGVMNRRPTGSPYDLNKVVFSHLLDSKTEGSFTFRNPGGQTMVVIYDTLDVNKWKIAAVFPEQELLSKVNAIKWVIASSVLAVILLALLLSNLLARVISEPIRRLANRVNRIDGEQLSLDTSGIAQHEINVLHDVLHHLLHRIKRLIHEVRLEQEKKRTAEIAALQAQINPHFLYNTLYSIEQLCLMNGRGEEAAKMVRALSVFFRKSLSGGKERITVSEEMARLHNYMLIQQMRYKDDFVYEFDIDERLLHYLIPKLTLQPLVENAIYHGVKMIWDKGKIIVTGRLHDSVGTICVEDNGPGMDNERLQALIIHSWLEDASQDAQSRSFGLRNVHQRLKLHFGEGCGLHIDSAPGAGTRVTVTFRLEKEESGGHGEEIVHRR